MEREEEERPVNKGRRSERWWGQLGILLPEAGSCVDAFKEIWQRVTWHGTNAY